MAISEFFAHPHEAYSSGFYRDDDFDFDVRILLGMAPYGGADAGEVLQTIADIGEGDHEKWFEGWSALGARIGAVADASAAAGRDVSASQSYLRAANYLGTAVNAAAGLPDAGKLLPAFHAHRAAWDRFIDTVAYPAERISIPYEGATLPGYLVKPSDGPAPRPTLILVNGSDGPISGMWATGGLGGLQRGYNVLFFDGPGQQTMLFDHELPFRHDWEAVLTPVVDMLLARRDVDAQRLAVYGISQAGYWVPRAVAFEHRIAAAIVDPGVTDVSQSWLAHFPKSMVELVQKGEQQKFDRDMGMGMKFSKSASRMWNFRARPYMQQGYYDTMVEMLRYRLTNEIAAQITTPMFITSPEKEQFWPGQSEQLGGMLTAPHVVQPFTSAEGADFHCQPMARQLTDQRMFDWLDGQLAG